MQVAASRRRVQRRPSFRVFGIHIRSELQQQSHHALAVVNATLQNILSK